MQKQKKMNIKLQQIYAYLSSKATITIFNLVITSTQKFRFMRYKYKSEQKQGIFALMKVQFVKLILKGNLNFFNFVFENQILVSCYYYNNNAPNSAICRSNLMV